MLMIAPGDPDRVECPNCGARVRVRRRESMGGGKAAGTGDGFLRFFCPCGRRLKVPAENPPSYGKCPDCGRVVPVPSATALAPAGPEDRTVDLSPAELAMLEEWAQDHRARRGPDRSPSTAEHATFGGASVEVGLRVCPRCGKPVHMGAPACRHCGAAVPRR
jgi:endogenous inhibitor of DNA gyrase (YacG/DUF329 family)